MSKKNPLLLKTKNDIPFFGGRTNIHQPTINEIALISEENFHVGVRFLAFDKDDISKDNFDLDKMSNFDILMSMINDKSGLQYKQKATMVLALLFPLYNNITFEKDKIILKNDKEQKEINNRNFDEFKEHLENMFCLNDSDNKKKYNPASKRAEKIAEKLKKSREKVNKKKGIKTDENLSIYEYYISVLSVGESKSWNTLLDYTVPQLLDEFKRFQRKVAYEAYERAAIAGAQNLEEEAHWMIDDEKIS